MRHRRVRRSAAAVGKRHGFCWRKSWHAKGLLVLDEPTNDLDVETLDLLQELLDDYDGTVILVSHDRDFDRGHGHRSYGRGRARHGLCRWVERLSITKAKRGPRKTRVSAPHQVKNCAQTPAEKERGGVKLHRKAPFGKTACDHRTPRGRDCEVRRIHVRP